MKVENNLICEGCGYPLEQCKCRCPYCDETTLCDCCIGYSAVTGG